MRTPWGHDRARATLYHDLATSLEAGVDLRATLRSLAGRSGPEGTALKPLSRRAQQGASLSDAMEAEGDPWARFEHRLVAAGERSGRLPEALRHLGAHFDHRGRLRARLALGLAYPVALAHAAALLLPLRHLVLGSAWDYLRASVVPLALGWGALSLGAWAVGRARRTEAGRRALDGLWLSVPGVRGVVLASSRTELLAVLVAMVSSGALPSEALDSAAEATRLGALSDAAKRASGRVRAGEPLHAALAREGGYFPVELVEAVRLGEETGRLEELLTRAEQRARETAAARQQALLLAVVVLASLGVLALVVWGVVSLWLGYFRQLDAMLEQNR